MFPPGCARLLTNSDSTGSPTSSITMGIVVVACCAARIACPARRKNDVNIEPHQLACEAGEPVKSPVRPSPLEPDGLSPQSSRARAALASRVIPAANRVKQEAIQKARTPIRRIFAAGCAVATSGATRMPKASVTMAPNGAEPPGGCLMSASWMPSDQFPGR